MVLPVFLLGMALPLGSHSVRCANGLFEQTPAVKNNQGFAVSFRLQSGDDHGKNTHGCETEYEMQIAVPGGSTRETGWDNGNDAEWERSLAFDVEGFSANGERAVALIKEGGRFPMYEVLVYEVHMQEHYAYSLDDRFLKSLGATCAQALQVTGMTAHGEIVLGTGDGRSCVNSRVWRITANLSKRGSNLVEMLPAGAAIVPLVRGVRVGGG